MSKVTIETKNTRHNFWISEGCQGGFSWEHLDNGDEGKLMETAEEAYQGAITYAQVAEQNYISGKDERDAAFMKDLSLTMRIDGKIERAKA